MEKTKLTFTLEKETKNTVRFSEDVRKGKPAVVGTLYIQKSAMGTPFPNTVTVTMEDGK